MVHPKFVSCLPTTVSSFGIPREAMQESLYSQESSTNSRCSQLNLRLLKTVIDLHPSQAFQGRVPFSHFQLSRSRRRSTTFDSTIFINSVSRTLNNPSRCVSPSSPLSPSSQLPRRPTVSRSCSEARFPSTDPLDCSPTTRKQGRRRDCCHDGPRRQRGRLRLDQGLPGQQGRWHIIECLSA